MRNTFVFKKDIGQYVIDDLLFYDTIAHHYYDPHSQNFVILTPEEEASIISLNGKFEELTDKVANLTVVLQKLRDEFNSEMDDGK